MSSSEKPIAIVSGASRGIGRAIAMQLNQNGYTVVGLYKKSSALAAELLKLGIDMVQADVGKESDVQRTLKFIERKYGRVDVLINNAGIDIFGQIESYPVSSWDNMIATNLSSVFLLSSLSIPFLKQSTNPVIINISSRLGIDTHAESDFVVYGTIKAAINFFTIGLAKELSDTNIRVNAVIPTPTKTDLFDEVFTPEEERTLAEQGKLGAPEDVADLVLGLIEDTSKNGQLVFDKRVTL